MGIRVDESGRVRERARRQGLSPRYYRQECGPDTTARPSARRHLSYKPSTFIDSGLLVDSCSGLLGKKDLAFAAGGVGVRGPGSMSCGGLSTRGGGGGDQVEELLKQQQGRDSPLGIYGSSVDKQHHTLLRFGTCA